jgi:TorA maturation chaperone TorD
MKHKQKSPIPEIGHLLEFAASLNFTQADMANVRQLHADYMHEWSLITCEITLPFYRRCLRYFRNSS